MLLFLSSTLDGSIELFMNEYRLNPVETPVVYIPTAEHCFSPPRMLTERGSYQCLVERKFPVTICDLDTDSTEEMKDKMEHSKVIVCAGGNTFYLLYHMRRSGFDLLIPDLLRKGVIYVGSSAGSCVCSPDISYVKDEDDPAMAPDLKENSGLGLVSFEIYPHCSEDKQSTSEKIFLRDHQAVVVRDGEYRVLP